jgi:hypothetical protein
MPKKVASKTAVETAGSKTSESTPIFDKKNLWKTTKTTMATKADGKKSSRLLELMHDVSRTVDDPVEKERIIIIGNKDVKVYAWKIAMTILEHGSAHAVTVQIKNFNKLMEIHKKVLGILTYSRMRVNSYKDVQIRSMITSVNRAFKDGIQVEYHLVFLAQQLDPLPAQEDEKNGKRKAKA